jgi:hypothetical protein
LVILTAREVLRKAISPWFLIPQLLASQSPSARLDYRRRKRGGIQRRAVIHMAIQKRFCVNHPQRPAIGICVITHVAICGECSTRYEGVNYSKEGLEILHKQRGTGQKKSGKFLPVLAWLLSPVMLYLVYLGYSVLASILADMLHRNV